MSITTSPDKPNRFAASDAIRARRTFAFMCGVNFVVYAMGHHGGGALLTLLLASVLISQVKMPDAKVGGKTAPDWMMKSPRINEEVADLWTSPRMIIRLVTGFLLVSAALGAVL